MNDNARWVHPLGTIADRGWEVAVDEAVDGWQHTGLYAGRLAAGERREVAPDEWEHVVVPLSGTVTVSSEQDEAVLSGRASVFAGPTDVAYVARGRGLTVLAHDGPARVAVCAARASGEPTSSFRHVPAADVPVELRGAGTASREVRNFGIPGVLDADSIIACEVITPAGNWSSYPPHKHDEEREGVETELEEIYYFEVQVAAGSPATEGADPVGYQRVYGTDERPIDVLAEVRTGDVVLVPHGWHGPAMAAPGYDLYYLNVMAGPGDERAWLICDDPAHGWVRQTWEGLDVDPRLPLGGTR
ncbi:5-deoxy-glucuronate isomerase [Phycicoccus sp. Root563]|uniref:5-deoxy-glucuronate isomerase n=1 Tax=Phycicoccus sp. Root563 TaxID=1736562 RepID=UPI00070394BE|nr:5-deoxy-glucuronate isomerase [Phycicoccus sp. Root563]KQZ89892.1 5-deoxy-glucuronate isomerase [Phycicoccus sp. Root563]